MAGWEAGEWKEVREEGGEGMERTRKKRRTEARKGSLRGRRCTQEKGEDGKRMSRRDGQWERKGDAKRKRER